MSILSIHCSRNRSSINPSPFHLSSLHSSTMSDICGNCDCADKSSCVKKGYSAEHIFPDAPAAAEFLFNDGKCKCGSSCSCVDCSCGH